MKKLLLVMVVFLLVGVANAAINWEPTVVDPTTGTADWSLTTSWGGGSVPVAGDVVIFREYSGVECQVTGDEAAANVRIGRRGDYSGPLRIMPGGTLTCGENRSYVGDDYVGHMVVERGGTFDGSGSAIRVGDNSGALGSTLTINGGTVITTTDSFSLALGGGGGDVDLNGGLIEAYDGEGAEIMIGVDNTIDISFGKIVIHEDITTDVAEEIAAGRLTAFDGEGTVAYSLNGNTTTITSTDDPLSRFPTYDELVQVGDVDLSWVNLAPVGVPANPAPTEVWVDVYYGTDVSSLALVGSGKELNLTTAPVSAPVTDEHVWRVDTYRNGDPSTFDYEVNDPNFVLDVGVTMYFIASDDEPPSVVINTPSTATWIDEPITLTATISDDDKSDVTIVWTSDEDPNAVFDPPTTTYPKGTVTYPLVSTTSVTVDYQTNYFTVTATVSDLNPLGETDSYTVEHHCAGTPCGAARSQFDLDAANPADLDGDCDHDLADFAIIAEDYDATGYALTEAQVFDE